MTTGRERVEAALALEVADRPPVSAWGHTYDREWNVADLAETTLEIAARLPLDFVKLQVRASCFAEAFGARWRYSGSPDAEPVAEAYGGDDAGAWRRIAEGPSNPQALSDQVEVVRRVVAGLGPATPLLQTVFSASMVAWFLAGRDTGRLHALLRGDRGSLDAGLGAIATALAGFTRDSIAAGAAGVFYAINPHADTSVMAPDEYRELFLAHDRTVVAAASDGWFNMLHLCSGHIDLGIAEALRLECVNWSREEPGNPGLAEVRDRLQVAVAGGVERYAPIRASTASVHEEAAGAVRETGGRGLLLATGCSASPFPKVKEENLAAMVAAAEGR